MQTNDTTKSLQSRVIQTIPIDWRKMQFLQLDDFKTLPQEVKSKLKASLIANQFTQPFYVWQDPVDKTIFCLDGRHRVMILEELISEGYGPFDVLPATFIHCENKQEAAKLVLIYSSQYAKITENGLFDFLQMFELSFEELTDQVELPSINIEKFTGDIDDEFSDRNQEFDLDSFNTDMTLKLIFSRDKYLKVKEKLTLKMETGGFDKPESVILNLLEIE